MKAEVVFVQKSVLSPLTLKKELLCHPVPFLQKESELCPIQETQKKIAPLHSPKLVNVNS